MAWFGVLAMLTALQAVHGILNATSIIVTPDGISVYPCLQLDHKEPVLERSMLGSWYAIEIIQHRNEPKNRVYQATDACPSLNLIHDSPTIVKMIWHEKGGDIHYTFKMTDPENGGWWMVWKKQEGSMVTKSGYEPFVGSVQMLESQANRMILRFCATNQAHFSVVLVRNITYVPDTRDVHQTLTNYGLQEVGVRQTCRNKTSLDSAAQSLPTVLIILTSAFFLVFRLN